MNNLLLCDLDDTLIRTGFLYDESRRLWGEFIAGYLDPQVMGVQQAIAELDAYDAQQCRLLGYGATRVEESMLHIAQKLYGKPLGLHATANIKAIARYPFDQVSPPMPGAERFLANFKEEDWTVILLTAGDQTIQTKRVEDFPYKKYLDGVRIVPFKTAEVMREICLDHGVGPSQTWMVGNSYYVDILPAQQARIHAAWLQGYSWTADHHENPDLTGVLIGTTLEDIQEQIFVEEGFYAPY